MSEAWLSLEYARQRREQQRENTARHASVFAKHTTSGTGESLSGLVRFSTSFTEPPYVSTGAVIKRLPDVAHYRYPTVTAGVIRWETRSVGPDPLLTTFGSAATGTAPDDPRPKLYVGAWLVFTVQCDPRSIPNTDGSNLAALEKQAAAIPNKQSQAYRAAAALVAEAKEAIWLLTPANKAKVVVEHHLTFSGVAVKAVEMKDDPLLQQHTFRPETGLLRTQVQ